MSRRNQLRTLLHVRQAREQVARGELSRHIVMQGSTLTALHDAREELAQSVLPREATPQAFLAVVASRRAQVQQVYALAELLEQRRMDVANAHATWQAADQSRAATLKLVDRDKQARDTERERADARERDDRRVVRLGTRSLAASGATEYVTGL